jgi:hypothetical protein
MDRDKPLLQNGEGNDRQLQVNLVKDTQSYSFTDSILLHGELSESNHPDHGNHLQYRNI